MEKTKHLEPPTLQPRSASPVANGEAQSCTNCQYRGAIVMPNGELRGVCRFAPPTVHVNLIPAANGAQLHSQALWPLVSDDDWCGEYRTRLAS